MKFIESGADSITGNSYVTVKHKGSFYDGFAHCHPDDEFSKFTGCRYAHERAEINALKAELKQKKHDCEECRKFVVAVSQYAGFDKTTSTAKAMFRQLNLRIKEVNKLTDIINKKEFNLNVAIRQQDGFNKRVEQNRLTNNEEK